MPATRRARAGSPALTKALANEWAPHGVNVNAIAPGLHRRPTTRRRFATTRCATQQILDAHPGRPLGRAGGRRRRGRSSSPRPPPTTCTASFCRSTAAGSADERRRERGRGARVCPTGAGRCPCALDDASAVADLRALLAGGSRPSRSPSGRPPRPRRSSAASRRSKGCVVGAGTVLTAGQARPRAEAGARVRRRPRDGRRGRRAPARELGLPFVPGRRHADGDRARARGSAATVVKLFPASLARRPRVPSRRCAPSIPEARFMPTGGIDAGIARARTSTSRPCSRCGGSWICDAAGCSRERRVRRDRAAARARRWRRSHDVTARVRPATECRYDLVALGEVMLRLDPGDGRIATTRTLRGLRGRRRVQRRPRAAALLRPAHGDRDRVRRQPGRPADRGPDAPGRRRPDATSAGSRTTASAASVRNGLNFTERGFGVRARARLLRPRPLRRVAAASRATSTGTPSSAATAPAGSTAAASSRALGRARPRSRSRR